MNRNRHPMNRVWKHAKIFWKRSDQFPYRGGYMVKWAFDDGRWGTQEWILSNPGAIFRNGLE